MREAFAAAALFAVRCGQAIAASWQRQRFIAGQLDSGVTLEEAHEALREVQQAGLIS